MLQKPRHTGLLILLSVISSLFLLTLFACGGSSETMPPTIDDETVSGSNSQTVQPEDDTDEGGITTAPESPLSESDSESPPPLNSEQSGGAANPTDSDAEAEDEELGTFPEDEISLPGIEAGEIETFSLDTANKTLPDDVYQEVSYFAGGGSGWNCGSAEIDEYDFLPYDSQVEPYDQIAITTCQWREGDVINVSIQKPQGEIISRTLIYGQYDFSFEQFAEGLSGKSYRSDLQDQIIYAENTIDGVPLNDYGDLDIYFIPPLVGETGNYIINIESGDREFSHPFTVTKADGPRIYREGQSRWLLYNFEPGEQIRILAYGNGDCLTDARTGALSAACLRGWSEYQTNEAGAMMIDIEVPVNSSERNDYIFIGENSPPFFTWSAMYGDVIKRDRQVKLDWMPVLMAEDFKTPIKRLNPGTIVHTLGDIYTHYYVELADGTKGWVPVESLTEGDVDRNFAPVVENFETDVSSLAVWVYIPPAADYDFEMGARSLADYYEVAEQPSHYVELSDFWIQRTEVSNRDYQSCVEAAVCTPPQSTSSETRNEYFGNDEFADYPVIYVTHSQAQSYCEWQGGSLPTEAQWEYAARYPHGRYYVWTGGADAAEENPGLLNFDKILGDTSPVFSYLDGATDSGLFNLHGNVWEWTSDWYDADYYSTTQFGSVDPAGPETGTEKVARGGSWSTSIEYISLTNRFNKNPNDGYNNVGFRCVKVDS